MLVWKSVLLISVALVLLRITGRKSISQMTIAQTIIMISIGSLIVQPIIERSIQRTIISAIVFSGFIILIEYLQLKFNFLESLLSGKSKVIIEKGKILESNLTKMRLTVDQLEMRLRQQGISKITDVKTATLEPNGQLGYELMRHAKPVTIGELEQMLGNLIIKQNPPLQNDLNIFSEIRGNISKKENPERLQ